MTSDVALTDLGQTSVPGLERIAPQPVRQPAGDAMQLVHDLRQPIALLRILLTVVSNRPDVSPAVAETLAQVNGQVTWLSELVGQWEAARNGTASPEGHDRAAWDTAGQSPSHVVDVLGAVVDSFAASHPGRLTWEVHAQPWVQLSSTALRRALTNLVDNAIRCAAPEGVVLLRVGVSARRAYVEVEDDGPGFRPSAEHAAFGLSIVTEIATAAGGSLEIGAGHLGGVRAVLRIPAIRTRTDKGDHEPASV